MGFLHITKRNNPSHVLYRLIQESFFIDDSAA